MLSRRILSVRIPWNKAQSEVYVQPNISSKLLCCSFADVKSKGPREPLKKPQPQPSSKPASSSPPFKSSDVSETSSNIPLTSFKSGNASGSGENYVKLSKEERDAIINRYRDDISKWITSVTEKVNKELKEFNEKSDISKNENLKKDIAYEFKRYLFEERRKIPLNFTPEELHSFCDLYQKFSNEPLPTGFNEAVESYIKSYQEKKLASNPSGSSGPKQDALHI
jgi:hypothetical protein